jgi:hypothetical protein
MKPEDGRGMNVKDDYHILLFHKEDKFIVQQKQEELQVMFEVKAGLERGRRDT